MTTNYTGAIDEIFALFNTAWKAGTTAIVGYIPAVEWPGIEADSVPDESKCWARLSIQPVVTTQGTLCENIVQLGARRFENKGLVFVQIFAPKRKASNLQLKQLAMLVQSSLSARTLNVTLKNARIQELPPESGSLKTNVVVEYEFDEIR